MAFLANGCEQSCEQTGEMIVTSILLIGSVKLLTANSKVDMEIIDNASVVNANDQDHVDDDLANGSTHDNEIDVNNSSEKFRKYPVGDDEQVTQQEESNAGDKIQQTDNDNSSQPSS